MLTSTSIKAVNRGYWDPSETTVAKYTTTYASELTARNLTHDFTGLSTLLLGQAQPAQFQSQSQTGYWWGSKVSDDGNFTTLGSVTFSNRNTEIPRSYHQGNDSLGDFYNWFTATAETGTISMASGSATDSICPKGWQLPFSGASGTITTNKTWENLLNSSYELSATDALLAKHVPLSLSYSGYYSYNNANISGRDTTGTWWTSVPRDDGASIYYARYFHLADSAIIPQNVHSKSGGLAIRCIKK